MHGLGKSSPSVSSCLLHSFTDSSVTRHSLCLPYVTVLLLNEITHAFLGPFLLSDSRLWRGQLTCHGSKGLSTIKWIAPSNLSAASAFCSLTRLACAQVLSGVSQVQLSGYLFVYTVIIIIISFPDQLIAFLAPLSASSSITFCFSLLFLGWKFPEMVFNKELQNKKQIVSGECHLPIFFFFCFVSDAEVSLAGNKMNPRDSK